MRLTPEEEQYTRDVAAQIGRDPEDLIREGEQIKARAYQQAEQAAHAILGGGRGAGMVCQPGSLAYPPEPDDPGRPGGPLLRPRPRRRA